MARDTTINKYADIDEEDDFQVILITSLSYFFPIEKAGLDSIFRRDSVTFNQSIKILKINK